MGTIEGTIEERVKLITADLMGTPVVKLTRDTNFIQDLGADSLDTIEMIMEVEDEFDMNIPDEAAEKITTIGDAVAYIEARQ